MGSNEIDLKVEEILFQVGSTIKGSSTDITISHPRWTTSTKALNACTQALEEHDENVFLASVRTPAQRKRIRELALESQRHMEGFSEGPSSVSNSPALRIRNSGDPKVLPTPNFSTAQSKAILKENLKNFPPVDRDPYVNLQAKREDQFLPAIAGKLRLSGIDGTYGDPIQVVTNDQMLFDTGSHYCYVTEDILDDHFIRYLKEDEKNECYRTDKCVQAEGLFTFWEGLVPMELVFRVIPKISMPNGRSGIFLGQYSFLDRLMYRAVPRLFLIADGKDVPETLWGDIVIEKYFDSNGKVSTL
jgi:hypothetical protein